MRHFAPLGPPIEPVPLKAAPAGNEIAKIFIRPDRVRAKRVSSAERKRVLIVDDEHVIADTLATIFTNAGYEKPGCLLCGERTRVNPKLAASLCNCRCHPSGHFLGFTHVWVQSRQGKDVVRQSTAKNRFARALASVSDWCRHNLHRAIGEQHLHLSRVMRGHFVYYGITGNGRRLRWYAHQVERIWQKWLSRRGQQGSFLWTRLHELLQRRPLPSAKIVHRYIVGSEALP